MSALVDVGTILLNIPTGSGNTVGASLKAYPRQLATSEWVISVTTAPSAACLFELGVGTTEGGSFATISSFTWPVGETGQRQVALGVQGNMAMITNSQSLWLKCSVTTSGTFAASSWLTKPGGRVGTGSQPGAALSAL